MNSFPSVGIALTVYKPHKDYFFKQLHSIFEQTFQDWVCIISFDSNDIAMLEDSQFSFVKDQRFIILNYEKQFGFKKNFQRAYEYILNNFDVKYIAFSDQDDIWESKKLSIMFEVAETRKHSLFHSDLRLLKCTDGEEKVLPESLYQWEKRTNNFSTTNDLVLRNLVTGAASFIRASLIRKYSTIPDYIDYHDYWFALAASREDGIYFMSESLGYYRQHENNVVGVNKKKKDLLNIFETSYRRYIDGREIVQGLINDGFKITSLTKFSFLFPWDFGLGFIFLFVMNIHKGEVIKKACLVRCVGKIIFSFRRG